MIYQAPHREKCFPDGSAKKDLLKSSLEDSPETVMLAFKCAHCGRLLQIQDEFAGKNVRCRLCGGVVVPPAQAPLVEPWSSSEPPTRSHVAADERTRTAPPDSGARSRSQGSAEPLDFLAPAQEADEIGRLGSYRVLAVLGRGGMGAVLQAEDPQLRRRVALKVMLPSQAANPSARQRFLREAQAAATLEHDHIVAIYHVGEERGVPFLAMPLLKGESLDERLKREGTLPPAEVVRIGRETALGLAAAHAQGVIHRDIKPGNLWLEGGSQRVKILDFGLAYQAGSDVHLTQSGAILGTPAYMAPEQAQGKKADARSDLFSLGCVLYRMSTGQLPFQGTDTMSMLLALVTQDPTPPGQHNPHLPPALNELILALLAKEPAARPASAEAAAQTLAALEGKSGPAPGPARITHRLITPPANEAATTQRVPSGAIGVARSKRRPWLLAGGLGAALAGVLAGVLLFGSGSDNRTGDPPSPPPRDKPPDPKPQPVAAPNPPLSRQALVREPAKLPGVRSWSIDTRTSRMQVRGLAVNHRNAWLAWSSADGTVRIANRNTGKVVRVLIGHPKEVGCLAWSPDGQTLATGCNDHLVRLWLVEQGRLVRTLTAHTGPVRALAWSPGGRRLAAAGDDRVVRIWRVAAGKSRALPGHEGGVVGLAWSPDGQWLASQQQGLTLVWEVATWQVRHRFPAGDRSHASLAWSRDSAKLACVRGTNIQIWDLATDKIALEWAAHQYHTYTVAWSPNGHRLASLGHDHVVKIWRFETGRGLHENRPQTLPRRIEKPDFERQAPTTNFPAAIEWGPRNTFVAYSSWDGVQVWRPGRPRPAADLPDHGWGSYTVTLDPKGRQLATQHHDARSGGTVRFWDLDSAQLVRTLPVINGHLESVAWSPNGKALAAGGFAQEAHIIDLDSGSRHELPGVDHPVHVSWSPDGRMVAVGDSKRIARLYDATTYRLLHPLTGAGKVDWVRWSADSAWLAAGSDRRTRVVRLFEAATGEHHLLEGHQGAVPLVEFAPGSEMLACGGEDRTVRLWAVKSRRLLRPLHGHTGPVTALAWAPAGNVLASGSEDQTVRLWDAGTGQTVQVLTGQRRRIGRLAWSPDGKFLAVSSGVQVWLWDVPAKRLRHRLRGAGPDVLAWARAGATLVTGGRHGILQVWDVATGRLRCLLVNLQGGHGVAITPDGHYAGTPKIENLLVYVIDTGQGQETLTPAEFAQRFSWKNDPSRIQVNSRKDRSRQARATRESPP
jgi:WD40 repeat protein/serine/threonine protein kinase